MLMSSLPLHRLVGTWVLVLTLAPLARAQESVDLDPFLAEVEQAAARVQTLYARGTRTIAAVEGEQLAGPEVTVEVLMAFEAPRHFRMVVESPLGGKTLQVCDGKYVWTYLPDSGEFTRQFLDPAQDPHAMGEVDFDLAQQTREAIVGQLIPQGVPDPTLLREVVLSVGGEDVPCVVIEFQPLESRGHESLTITQWIEKDRHVVRREERRGQQTVPGGFMDVLVTTVFDEVRVDEPLDSSLFEFTPPTTAAEVDQLRRRQRGVSRSPWIGKEAPDFELSDIKGMRWTLSDLRGRVVLLDFWATWCGPCKIELPHVQALHEEFKNDGLVVLGISNEPRAKVERYIQAAKYTFPSLVDADAQVTLQYRVSSIPTIMILDREGKVAEHLIGAQSEEALRKALSTVGIE